MGKARACFYCRNCGKSKLDIPGWSHDCKLGIDNIGFDDENKIAELCKEYDSRKGFQMGGYYTHMWFEYYGTAICDGGEVDGCLEWVIQGDLEFPISDDNLERKPIKIHICDFGQIENWVSFWGKELRKRGWISE